MLDKLIDANRKSWAILSNAVDEWDDIGPAPPHLIAALEAVNKSLRALCLYRCKTLPEAQRRGSYLSNIPGAERLRDYTEVIVKSFAR